MTDDWKNKLAQERALREQSLAKAKARKAYFDGIGPVALANLLTRKLEIRDLENPADVTERLERQALALDTLFYANLHNAGLGHKAALEQDPLTAALAAQKQCRQTFDSLKPLQIIKSRKQKEGLQKC